MKEQQIKAKSGVIKKKPNGKFATGRPTDYKPEYCKDIVDYMSKEAHLIVIDKTYYKSPDFIQKNQVEIGIPVNEIATWTLKSETHKVIANRFPTFQRWCHEKDIVTSTMYRRTEEYPEFWNAYTKAKAIQESILIENTMQGVYNPGFAMFIAKNNFWYKDKTEVVNTNVEIQITEEQKKKLLDRFELDEQE